MGTEVSSENCGWTASPRISFSQDISMSDGSITNVRPSLPLDPDAAEFDFSISSVVSVPDPSPADELFSDGKILPLPIKNCPSSLDGDTAASSSVLLVPRPPNRNHRPVSHDLKGSLREVMDAFEDDDQVHNSSRVVGVGGCRQLPFWRFGRSSSIGSCKSRGSLICPFPLARSKSTGSFLNQNPNPNPSPQKPRRKTNQHNIDDNQRSSEAAKSCYYNQPRSSSSSSSGNVMRINVPAPNFPRGSSRITGSNNNNSNTSVLAYLLCNCKDKNMERSAPGSSP